MMSDAVHHEVRSGMVAVGDIVTVGRVRHDYGDLIPLMQSMQQQGQLHPIGIGLGNHLLFGGRRLEAAKKLGWPLISCVCPKDRVDALAVIKAEQNVCGIAMTSIELVEFGRRLEAIEAPKSGRRRRGSASQDGRDGHAVARAVAEALGMTRASYERVRRVVKVADGATDAPPAVREIAQQVLAMLDRGEITVRKASDVVLYAKTFGAQNTTITARVLKTKISGPRRNHHQILTSLTDSLAGMVTATSDIYDLDTSIAKADAGRLGSDLATSIRSLKRIQVLLKERNA